VVGAIAYLVLRGAPQKVYAGAGGCAEGYSRVCVNDVCYCEPTGSIRAR